MWEEIYNISGINGYRCVDCVSEFNDVDQNVCDIGDVVMLMDVECVLVGVIFLCRV